MRELNVKEIQEVNGGVAPLVVIGAKFAARVLFGLGMSLLTSKKAY